MGWGEEEQWKSTFCFRHIEFEVPLVLTSLEVSGRQLDA